MRLQLTSLILLVLTLSGCSGRKPSTPMSRVAAPQQPVESQIERGSPLPGHYTAPGVSGDFVGYRELDEFIARMEANHGIPRDYLNELFSQTRRRQDILDLMNRQTGSPSTIPSPGAWSRYRAKFLTELHIEAGATFWAHHAQSLQQASERFGVPPEYILGIMGVETVYGRNVGKTRVIDALATLAFDYPRRAKYFTEELENFLVMTHEEGIDPLQPQGSYAGAMGLGQFMPGSFLKWAVDFDGDGRRDLWQAEDAIGSIANYFAQNGWHPGETVVTPAIVHGPVNLLTGYERLYSLSELASQGITPAAPVPNDQRLSLLLLRGNDGDEYWLGHHNFYVITRYNHSTHYAMAVHELAQAIKRRYLGGIAKGY